MRKLESPKTGSGRPQHSTVTVSDIMTDRDKELGQTLRQDLPYRRQEMQECTRYGESERNFWWQIPLAHPAIQRDVFPRFP
jgi:hypothetical protein